MHRPSNALNKPRRATTRAVPTRYSSTMLASPSDARDSTHAAAAIPARAHEPAVTRKTRTRRHAPGGAARFRHPKIARDGSGGAGRRRRECPGQLVNSADLRTGMVTNNRRTATHDRQ